MVTSEFVGWQSVLWMSVVWMSGLVAVGLAVCAARVAVWLVRERGHRQTRAVQPTPTLAQQQLPLGLVPVNIKWRARIIRRWWKRLMF